MFSRFVTFVPNAVSNRLIQLYFQAGGIFNRRSHSMPSRTSLSTMDVRIIPALEDNYMYLLTDKATYETAVIDPVEPDAIMKIVKATGLNLTTVLTTHYHMDHSGGNKQIKESMPHLKVYGGGKCIPALTDIAHHDLKINIGNLVVKCLATPFHTSDHICYYVTDPQKGCDRVVFTGDTLFVGGCGRFFEGTLCEMYKSLCETLFYLPEDTKVYCGHEYSIPNLKFAAIVEPLNYNIDKKLKWCLERRQQKLPTVPSTILEEKSYNPFLRVMVPAVNKYVGSDDPVQVLKVLRFQKDNFTE